MSFINALLQRNLLLTLFFPVPASPGKNKNQSKTHFRQKTPFLRRAELGESPKNPSEDFVVVVGFVQEMKGSEIKSMVRNPGIFPEQEWNCDQVGIVDPPGVWHSQKQPGVEIWGVNSV